MRNKKGFTLTEIIVVIAILVVVAGIFSVNMINTLNKNKEEEGKTVVTQIKAAADTYVSTNPSEVEKLYNGFGFVDIPVGDLRDAGLLSEDLKDAETGELIPDDAVVRAKLEQGDSISFTFPVAPEELEAQAWTLVAEDLTIDYDQSISVDTWCANRQNIYKGLYDSNYTNLSNYSSVVSKLYLMDNSNAGAMYTGDYFNDANLTVTSCNVNPQVAGTYNIIYEYTDPSLNVEKTMNRTVYVRTSGNDVISFTAAINNGGKITLNAANVPITIVETYKDGSTATFNSTAETLNTINYNIANFSTATIGTRTATISSTKTNSDGSTPTAVQVSYTVTDSLAEMVDESKQCTTSSTSGTTCYYRCTQVGNYVNYNGYIYRIYSKTGTSIKLIYNGTEIKGAYGQLGNCTNNSCCNGGRYIYNKLGDSSNVPSTTMDSILDSFYTSKNVAGTKVQSQSTIYGSKKVALLSRSEYSQISTSCSSNYLTGVSFWLLDAYSSYQGAVAYNMGSLATYSYEYAVNTNGTVGKAGSYKDYTFEGDYGTTNVKTDILVVRPTIQLNNPTIASGNGTQSSPYVIR